MNILFRSDSSSNIGTGHIMRDLVLAEQYKNDNVYFASLDLEGNINNKIIEHGYSYIELLSHSKHELVEIIKKNKIDFLIVDHYGIDKAYEKFIKKHTGVTLLCFDDTYEEHYSDIVLNHNITADENRYKGIVPKWTEVRCGIKYTLLREEFYKEKRKKKVSKKAYKKSVFIAMGGADHSNININVLKVLSQFDNLDINLVTTKSNKNLQELREFCKNRKEIDLHVNSTSIAKLMRKSDFAIVTPSVTVNEVYFMELPFIAIKTASNQKEIYKSLKKQKFLTLKKFSEKKLSKMVVKQLKLLKEK